MHNRDQLRTELIDLTARLAVLADHIERAARSHDHQTVQSLNWEIAPIEKKIELVSFDLTLMDEAERACS
jgi:hypothetical protein